jgi:hypothetical protein
MKAYVSVILHAEDGTQLLSSGCQMETLDFEEFVAASRTAAEISRARFRDMEARQAMSQFITRPKP